MKDAAVVIVKVWGLSFGALGLWFILMGGR